MIHVVAWLWGGKFSALYVERLQSMLKRHLHLPHEMVLITDRPMQMRDALPLDVRIIPMPLEHAGTPRCRRRMWHFARERMGDIGRRILTCDLDVVITDDITPLVDRPEPIVCWKVGYAGVYSGSFMLFDAGALDGAWQAYRADPYRYPAKTGERNASDQAMVNYWLKQSGTKVAEWTEKDGFVTWFGEGYEDKERYGMGPRRNKLKPGTRIVVLGSADKAVMDEGRYEFVRRHWR